MAIYGKSRLQKNSPTLKAYKFMDIFSDVRGPLKTSNLSRASLIGTLNWFFENCNDSVW